MAWDLSFERMQVYDPGEPGITVPVKLISGAGEVLVNAKLDCGASDCIFERGVGESLGIAIESGYRTRIGLAIGGFTAYGHFVTLAVAGYDFEAMVYFAADPEMQRNVLGRHGFLNRVRLGLIDYEGQLFFSRNDNSTA